MEQDALADALSNWASRLSARSRACLSTYDLRALYDASARAAEQGSERPLRRWIQELSPAARSSLSDYDVSSLMHTVVGEAPRPGALPSVPRAMATELGPPARPEHARLGGYTGDTCNVCGGAALVRAGTCITCQDCGSTTGCA